MFTGIIEGLGIITSIRKTGNGIRLCLKPVFSLQSTVGPQSSLLSPQPKDCRLPIAGESISVNGVCLTVAEIHNPKSAISFDVSPETLKSTTLGELKVNDKVNLERALRATDRLGGHIVTGHVDGVGSIKDKRKEGEYTFYTFSAPAEVLRYLVKKGSVAVDGISLTVIDIGDNYFKVATIPHTLKVTTLGFKGIGDRVNLEADILGKYVEKFLYNRDNRLMERLKEEGYVNGKV